MSSPDFCIVPSKSSEMHVTVHRGVFGDRDRQIAERMRVARAQKKTDAKGVSEEPPRLARRASGCHKRMAGKEDKRHVITTNATPGSDKPEPVVRPI